jgi:C4-dicarboxylate-specific signal transduction histidine kinase
MPTPARTMTAASLSPDWFERVNRLAIIAALVPGTVHDINNALQVISGSAELLGLAAGGAAEQITRRGLAISEQARRATGSLAELTELVRDGSEGAQRFNLKELADRAVVLRQHALCKGKIEAAVDGVDVPVRANPRQVLQIVLNLVLNAERAVAGRSDARFQITTARTDRSATLTVSDNGDGVNEDLRATLFAQPTSAGRNLPQQLGIGLFVSTALAARNGGQLTYAPAASGGSTFMLTLPAA